MNGAILDIQVRVAARQAAADLAGLDKQVRSLGTGAGASGGGLQGFFNNLDKGSNKLTSFGKNLQWTGRQMTMNFTLPIVAAAAAAAKFELANETAATGLRKVYGLVGNSVGNVDQDLKTLDTTMDLLSRKFGVQKAKVYDVAKAWAEAGLTGGALQRAVQNSLEASVVGSIDLEKATTGLIAIQAAYQLSTVDLRKELANLDLIQVQSGVSFGGLIDVIQRAGSTAAVAGIDIRHLAAMAASITPAAGTAAQAGNALRTIISRMLVPSKDASDLMAQMGINIEDASWSTKTGTERFEMLVAAIDKLPDSQKTVVDSFIAGRFQLNRFSALITDAAKANGFYQRSLENTQDPVKALATYQNQLNTVLSSNPQKLKIIGVTLQNSLANIIAPMLPSLLGLVNRVVQLVVAFSHLSPQMQQFILSGLAFLAIIGPMVRYVGAFATLFGTLGTVIGWTGGQLIKLASIIRVSMAEGILGKWIQSGVNGFGWLVRTAESAWVAIFGSKAAADTAIVMEQYQTAQEVGGALATIPGYAEIAWGEVLATATTTYATIEAETLALTSGVGAELLALGPGVAASAGAALVVFGAEAEAIQAMLIEVAATIGFTASSGSVVWAGSMASIVATTAIAGTEVVTIWVATMASMEAVTVAGVAAIDATLETMPLALLAAVAEALGLIEGLAVGAAEVIPLALEAAATDVTAAAVGAAESIPLAFGGAIDAASVEILALGPEVEAGLAGVGSTIAGIPVAVVGAIAVAAAMLAAAVVVFRKQIFDAIKWVIDGFGKLPGAIGQALVAVGRVIAIGVQNAIHWLSYLNPFARHSPSLVDYVTLGVGVISQKYRDLAASVSTSLASAAAAHQAFGAATAGGQDAFDRVEYQKKRDQIVSVIPEAAPATDNLISNIVTLKGVLRDLDPEIASQTALVASWALQLDAAKNKVDVATKVLNGLKDAADATKDQLDAAKQKLQDFANTPIAGMRAMEDEIFANTQAQKQLQLQILQMEDAVGPIDKIREKLAALQGEQELLKGERTDLRQAGAGSEILKVYDDQIAALQQQGVATQGQADQIQVLQDQLDKLARTGQELDLTKSLNFDGLQRQIDQAANAMDELPFDQIMAGITAQKAEVARLTGVWDQQTAAVRDQQKVVDDLTAARDTLSDTYDVENTKLETLKQSYADVTQQISDMEQALGSLASASSSSGPDPSQADKLFNAPAADFPDVTGNTLLGDEQSTQDMMDQFNKDLQDQIDKAGKAFGSLDIFKPLKDAWNSAWGKIKDITGDLVHATYDPIKNGIWTAVSDSWHWVRDSLGPFLKELFGGAGDMFSGIFSGIGDAAVYVWQKVLYPVFSGIGDFLTSTLGPVIQVFGTVFGAVFDAVGVAVSWLWNTIVQPVFSAIGGFFNSYIIPILQLFGALWAIAFKLAGDATQFLWDHVVDPVFSFIGDHIETIITGGVMPILAGLVWFFQNVMAPVFSWLYDNIVKPVFDAIGAVISFAWNSIIKPVLDAFGGFFMEVLGPAIGWIYDAVVKPTFDAIGSVISFAWNDIIKPVFHGFVDFIQNVLAPVFFWLKDNVIAPVFDAIGSIISAAWGGITTAIKDVANFFITAFNTIANGIKAVGDFVGVNVKINPMPLIGAGSNSGGGGNHVMLLAAGGVVPAGGGAFNSARAIVGEGSSTWPEYVIPTDPRYRKRAEDLYTQLGPRLMAGGGILGNIADDIDSVIHKITKGAVDVLAAPFLAAADVAIGMIPNDVARGAASWVKNTGVDWISNLPGLYDGGVVAGSANGTIVRVGERNQSEVITPLRKGVGTTVNFYGDLEFPNVTNGDDAEDFMDNLLSLVD